MSKEDNDRIKYFTDGKIVEHSKLSLEDDEGVYQGICCARKQ